MTVDELKTEIYKLSSEDREKLKKELGWVNSPLRGGDTATVYYNDMETVPTMSIDYDWYAHLGTEFDETKLPKEPILALIEKDISNIAHPVVKYCIERWTAMIRLKNYFPKGANGKKISDIAKIHLKALINCLETTLIINPDRHAFSTKFIKTIAISSIEKIYLNKIAQLVSKYRKEGKKPNTLVASIEKNLKDSFRPKLEWLAVAAQEHKREYPGT